ncbi:insulin-like growth factor 3 [Syngnathus acus]|uniref:insulin-like growth factor 3 n=1 Tax=Syngnathus acus TaxID=161584 RepID=UPI001885D6E5|nr:insulin-like growth factor 3 [Syngnathus acus]
MNSSRYPLGRLLPLKVSCMLCLTMCLFSGPLCSEAAKRRCGSELLSDLLFVCGDRGLYLGKGTWSGYGSRPRGKGIVDKCCRSNGCELHHLEMYCATAQKQQQTTAWPSTSTSMDTLSTKATDVAYQFQAVFQKRLLQHLGPPDSPKRETYSSKIKPSSRRKINPQHTTREAPTPRTSS